MVMNLIVELDLDEKRRVRLELRGEVLTITGYKQFSIPMSELTRALSLLRGNTPQSIIPATFEPQEQVVHRGQVRRMSSRWGMKARKADPQIVEDEPVIAETVTDGTE